MSWSDWASFVMAAATMVLAIFTWISASASRKAADAATKEASATSDLAQQAREDRELVWGAILNIQVTCVGNSGKGWAELVITNYGNGPALECTLWGCFSDQGLWGTKKNLVIAARDNSSQKLELDRTKEGGDHFPDEVFAFHAGKGIDRVGNIFVATYKDALGNYYRVAEGELPEKASTKDRPSRGWTDYV